MSYRIEPLQIDDLAASAIIAEAFAEDPLMRWVFDAESPGYEERLGGYARVGHAWHIGQGMPAVCARSSNEMLGVLYAMQPTVQISEASLASFAELLRAASGDASTNRFFAYHETMDQAAPDLAVHVLALIGVVPSMQRRGVGSALVRWCQAESAADSASVGVGLDTAGEANLAFYESLGFRTVVTERIGPVEEAFMVWDKPVGGGET